MSNVPNPTPQPIVLDYQRAQKAKRFATGGLFLMGLAITAIGTLLAFQTLNMMHHGFDRPFVLRGILITLLIVFWGISYVTCALLIRFGYRIAGWISLVLTSIQALGWLILFSIGVYNIVRGDMEGVGMKIIAMLLFLAITAGFLALPVEVWNALRNPQVWRR